MWNQFRELASVNATNIWKPSSWLHALTLQVMISFASNETKNNRIHMHRDESHLTEDGRNKHCTAFNLPKARLILHSIARHAMNELLFGVCCALT